MIDGMEIETHQFKDASYILIRVDIGQMAPHRAKEYIARLRDNTALCKQLDERNIPYDLVGVRSDNTNKPVSGMSVEPKVEDFTQDTKRGCGSKVETLPGGPGLGEVDDDLTEYRQKVLHRMQRIATTKTKTNPIIAERNEILKATGLSDDLKSDSFADAMKLLN